jgi:hypothetical protein
MIGLIRLNTFCSLFVAIEMLVIKINIRTMLCNNIYKCGYLQNPFQILLFIHICPLLSKFQIASTLIHIGIQLT